MTWNREDKYDITFKLCAFLLSPILGFVTSLLRLNTRSSFFVLFMVFLTFGFSMVTHQDRTEDFEFDSVAYRSWFEEAINDTPADFGRKFGEYLHLENHNFDFYCDTLNYIVSRFTPNYHVLFLVIAFVFAFFKLKLLRIFVLDDNYHLSLLGLVLLFIFSMNQIIGINTFRFYTALIIAIYALFQILVNGNRKYLLLLSATPFFHGTFVLMYMIMPLFYLTRNHWKIIAPLGIIFALQAIISPSIMASFITDVMSYISPNTYRFSLYTDVYYMQQINHGGTGYIWVQRLLEKGTLIMLDAAVVFYAIKYKSHIEGTNCEQLFKFLLIMTLFVNATIYIPSLGSRFMMFTFPMIAYIYLVCFSNKLPRHTMVYIFAAFYFVCMLMPWAVYQIPCLKFYTQLWEPCFLYTSPIYLFVRYIIIGIA